jgi:hypothetical protein
MVVFVLPGPVAFLALSVVKTIKQWNANSIVSADEPGRRASGACQQSWLFSPWIAGGHVAGPTIHLCQNFSAGIFSLKACG